MVLIEYRTYIPRGYGLIGLIIISFLYEELAARARENHATTEYLQARYIGKSQKFMLARFFGYYRKNQVLARFSTFRTFRPCPTLSAILAT